MRKLGGPCGRSVVDESGGTGAGRARVARAAVVSAGLRDRRSQDSCGEGRRRARESVEPRVVTQRRSPDHGASRAPADFTQRCARSRADCRRSRSAHHAARRLARRRTAPEFCLQPTHLYDLRQRRRRQSRDHGDDTCSPRRQEARGREGNFRRRQLEQLADQFRRPHGVRPRRHVVCRHRRTPGARPRAEHDAARRQGASIAR